MASRNDSAAVSSQVVAHHEVQEIPLAFEGIDDRNGWHDRGNPLNGFEEENAYDDTERINLCADEFAKNAGQWFLVGGSVRNENRTGPVNLKFKERFRPRQLKKALKRPSMMGYRLVAMILRLRPDLLEGRSAADLARTMRISARALAGYTISFGENFPAASKSIRRTSRLVNEEIIRNRHA